MYGPALDSHYYSRQVMVSMVFGTWLCHSYNERFSWSATEHYTAQIWTLHWENEKQTLPAPVWLRADRAHMRRRWKKNTQKLRDLIERQKTRELHVKHKRERTKLTFRQRTIPQIYFFWVLLLFCLCLFLFVGLFVCFTVSFLHFMWLMMLLLMSCDFKKKKKENSIYLCGSF